MCSPMDWTFPLLDGANIRSPMSEIRSGSTIIMGRLRIQRGRYGARRLY